MSLCWSWCAVALSALGVLLAAAYTVFTVIGAVQSGMRQPYALYALVGVFAVYRLGQLAIACWRDAVPHRTGVQRR